MCNSVFVPYVCICITSVCLHMYVCDCVYVRMLLIMLLCVYIYVCVFVCVGVFVRVSMCVLVCLYVCMYVSAVFPDAIEIYF